MPKRTSRPITVLAALGFAAVVASACGTPNAGVASLPDQVPPRAMPSASATYGDPANWLCRPDKADVCDGDLDTTNIAADGTTSIERWAPATDPRVDCFYVYPTVSRDAGVTSDLVPGDEEIRAVRSQAARFGSTCRVFAPLYHQVTVTALLQSFGGGAGGADADAIAKGTLDPNGPIGVGYADVVDAFRQYLANDSGGRGFILLGHSQGSTLLSRLINQEIAPDPALRARMVSAFLVGLPPGDQPDQAVTPPCTTGTMTGCYISYSSFRTTAPPPARAIFGRAVDGAVCTDPAALTGRAPALDATFLAGAQPWLDPAAGTITTPFVSVPGLLDGSCLTRDGFTWLDVTINRGPSGGRADDLPADLGPEWGMHLQDVQLALGDLVALATRQAQAYRPA
jgi:hypothetical protein